MINLFYFSTEIIVRNDFITFDTSRLIIVRSMWSVHVGYSRVIVTTSRLPGILSYARIRNYYPFINQSLKLEANNNRNQRCNTFDPYSSVLESFKFFLSSFNCPPIRTSKRLKLQFLESIQSMNIYYHKQYNNIL